MNELIGQLRTFVVAGNGPGGGQFDLAAGKVGMLLSCTAELFQIDAAGGRRVELQLSPPADSVNPVGTATFIPTIPVTPAVGPVSYRFTYFPNIGREAAFSATGAAVAYNIFNGFPADFLFTRLWAGDILGINAADVIAFGGSYLEL